MGNPIQASFKVICYRFFFLSSFSLPRSGFGHDKSQAILPYRDLDKPPTLLFFGDGVSGNLFLICCQHLLTTQSLYFLFLMIQTFLLLDMRMSCS